MTRGRWFAVIAVGVLIAGAVVGGVRWWGSDEQVERRLMGEVAQMSGVRDVDVDEKRVVMADGITVGQAEKVLERLDAGPVRGRWVARLGVAEIEALSDNRDTAAALVAYGALRDAKVERIELRDRTLQLQARVTVADASARIEIAQKLFALVAADQSLARRSWEILVHGGPDSAGGDAVWVRRSPLDDPDKTGTRLARLAEVLRMPVTLEVGRDGRISDLRIPVGDERDAPAVWSVVESVLEKEEVARIEVGEDPEAVTYSGAKGQAIEPALAAARDLRDAGATAVTEIDMGLTEITAETATLSDVGAVGAAAVEIDPELELAVTWPEPVEWYGDSAGPAHIVDRPSEVARVAPRLAEIAKLGYVILWGPELTGIDKRLPYVLAYPRPEGSFRPDELRKVMALLRGIGWQDTRLIGVVSAPYDCGGDEETGTIVAWIRSTATGRGIVQKTDFSRRGAACTDQIDAARPEAEKTAIQAWNSTA